MRGGRRTTKKKKNGNENCILKAARMKEEEKKHTQTHILRFNGLTNNNYETHQKIKVQKKKKSFCVSSSSPRPNRMGVLFVRPEPNETVFFFIFPKT